MPANAMPIQGFSGGLLIGCAAALMLLGLGRIAGVSGLMACAAGISRNGAPQSVAAAFILGLPVGTGLVVALTDIPEHFAPIGPALIAAGLLVGFGTRLGNGCTSGHGVCGLSRLSQRSIAATGMFMLSGFGTVFVMNAFGLAP